MLALLVTETALVGFWLTQAAVVLYESMTEIMVAGRREDFGSSLQQIRNMTEMKE